MLLLGKRNTAAQTVLTGGVISTGTVYRKYCKRCNCVPAFATDTDAVVLQQAGIYHITATFVGTGTAAGVVTVQMLENGVAVPAAFSSQTITTAGTELRTFVIDEYVLVDNDCVLGIDSTSVKSITFTNTGVGATFTAVTVNVDKVV